jgi:chromate transporter
MVDPWLLFDLFMTFAGLGLIAIGGQNTVLTEVYRQVVDVHRWMSAADLADLIALTQAAPGPNGQFVALVGLRVAGIQGFFVAGLALALPPAILAFIVARVQKRLASARWLRAVQGGMVPIVIGLIMASGLVSAEAADDTWAKIGLSILMSVVVWRTRWNPAWLLLLGAIIGAARL